jgi:protein-disulfide isomerase
MSKNFWIALAVVVLGLFAILKLTGGETAAPKSAKYANGNVLELKSEDHKAGAGNKKVSIIEYGDFQCPSCGRFYPLLEETRKEYGDDITFVFRHFPITSIHKNAQASSRAAEAAGKQGKFFEMYSKLYETQEAWSESGSAQSIFEDYASKLGLDVAKFKTDYVSEEINSIIAADLESGKKVGVTGTPSIFINGKQIENPADLASFKKLIDDAIAAANPGSPAPAPAAEPAPAQ